MEPHIYLQRGKKSILLVRYFDQLHFITLNHRMHRKVKAWFLEAPRTVAEMDEKGLSRTTLDLNAIRGVAAGGTGRGHVVQFYLKDGKRRYELEKDCDLADMGALFDGLESFEPPRRESNWQDARLAKQEPAMRNVLWTLGGLLDIVGFVSSLVILVAGYEIIWLTWVSLLCIGVSIVLYSLFPDYFTIFSEKQKYGKKKGVSELISPLICTMFMVASAIRHYRLFQWWKAWVIGGVAVLILAVVLYKLVPAFRAEDKVGMFLLAGLLFCGGPVLALNRALDPVPVREIQTVVEEKDSHSTRKGVGGYEFSVILDGEEMEIPVDGEIYHETDIGDRVIVEFYDGALGIPYVKID